MQSLLGCVYKRLRSRIKRLILNWDFLQKLFNYLPIIVYIYIRIWLFFNKTFVWLFLGSNMHLCERFISRFWKVMLIQSYVKRAYNLSKWLSLDNLSYNQTQTFQTLFLFLGFSSIFLNQGQRQEAVWLRSSMWQSAIHAPNFGFLPHIIYRYCLGSTYLEL